MTQVFLQNFDNYGFLSCQLTDDDLIPVLSEIEVIKNNFESSVEANKFLIGNIEKEFSLIESKDFLEKLILPLIIQYDKSYNFLSKLSMLSKNVPIILKNAWVNFQSKHEFNPNHNHDGVFSFVIWTKIPYDMTSEKRNSPGRDSTKNLAGSFEFQYTNILGEICSHVIHVDDSTKNVLLLFPAKLKHCVYPFYSSDDYRISVSGNFVLEV